MRLTGYAQMAFVKSGLTSREFHPCLDDREGALNVLRAQPAIKCVPREQENHGFQKFWAQDVLLSSFVLFRGKNGGKKNMWVEKPVLLSRC